MFIYFCLLVSVFVHLLVSHDRIFMFFFPSQKQNLQIQTWPTQKDTITISYISPLFKGVQTLGRVFHGAQISEVTCMSSRNPIKLKLLLHCCNDNDVYSRSQWNSTDMSQDAVENEDFKQWTKSRKLHRGRLFCHTAVSGRRDRALRQPWWSAIDSKCVLSHKASCVASVAMHLAHIWARVGTMGYFMLRRMFLCQLILNHWCNAQ